MITTVRSIRDQIVDQLRSDVLCSRIHPGVRLSEMELSKRFGVSRGPIREALSQLVHEGLLVAKPNCGVTVAAPPSKEVRELIIPIRRTVETYALKSYFNQLTQNDFLVWDGIVLKMELAARQEDEKELVGLDLNFHRLLVSRAGQPELLAIWQALVAQVRGHFGEKITHYRQQFNDVVEHHRKLIAIFRKGNCKAAVAALKQHIS